MNLFHVASVLGALGCALAMGIILAGYGVPATVLGVVAGLVGGWFAGPILVLAVFLVVVLLREGPRSALDLVRRRARRRG